MSFVHLHVHSYYSLQQGGSSPDSLIEKAKLNKQTALALTDINSIYGAVEFFKKCNDAGIKPLIGAAIDDSEDQSAVFLVKNKEGYTKLCSIITKRKLSEDEETKLPVKFNLCEIICEAEAREDLVILSDSPTLLRKLSDKKIKKNIYAEVYPPYTKTDRKKMREVSLLMEREGIPGVATNRVMFAAAQDYSTHKLLSAIRLLKTIDTLDMVKDVSSAEAWLKSSEEMLHIFDTSPELISNTIKIVGECNFNFEFGVNNYPKFPTESDPALLLKERCVSAIDSRYTKDDKQKALVRLEYELKTICTMGYADYFLIVKDIVDYARSREIPYVGRGSAADSIVSYLLRITDIDPIKHNLYFERFLNPERIDPPDIDVDFCWKRRDDVLNYVYEKYGYDKTAMISTHVKFELRSSVREAGKALGFSEGEVNQISKRIPHFGPHDLENVFDKIPEASSVDTSTEHFSEIIEEAKKITGFPRHLGIHPGGIVISPSPINHWTSLERAAKGLVVTQYEMRSIEELGLLKIDLLGQRSLSVIADVIECIKKRDGIIIRPEDLPMNDPETKRIMRTGKTIGCFQIESPGMRGTLQKLLVDEFEILTAASSLIRPGPKDSGMKRKFIKRHLGQEKTTYIHPVIESVLKDTYGVMVYQEDVLKIAQAAAGMPLGRADLLRRSMSAKKGAIPLADFKKEFIDGTRKNKIPDDIAEQIWKDLRSFAGYAFCKAHSASYAKISFQSTYLKAHYPAEFFAAVISNGGGFYDREAYVNEARRWGLTINPPSVNMSMDCWTGKDNTIQCGLQQIKNFTNESIEKILAERKRGLFTSPFDFLNRTKLPPSDLEKIALSGSMDEFGFSRSQIFFIIENYNRKRRENNTQTDFLEEEYNEVNIPELKMPSEEELFAQEYNALDVPIRFHPVELFRKKIEKKKIVKAAAMNKYKNRKVLMAGWIVTTRRVTTNKGELMKFVTLEDETDIFDSVLFPDVYSKFGGIMITRGPFLLKGRITHEMDVCTLEVEEVELIR